MSVKNILNLLQHHQTRLFSGLFLVVLIVAITVLGLFWQPWGQADYDLASKLQSPSAMHLLGTDIYGRDILALLIGGTCNAILVSLGAVGFGLLAGTLLGIFAATLGGEVDALVMRISDFMFAFPAILLAVMLITLLGAGITNAIVAIGLANIPVFIRLTRNTVRQILPQDYVRSAKALGRTPVGIFKAHVLPNLLPVIIVQITIQLSVAILAESALSYMDIGVQPPAPSLGRMLREAQMLIFDHPMLTIVPGLAIALAVFAFNQLGEGLRDLLDLRLKAASQPLLSKSVQ